MSTIVFVDENDKPMHPYDDEGMNLDVPRYKLKVRLTYGKISVPRDTWISLFKDDPDTVHYCIASEAGKNPPETNHFHMYIDTMVKPDTWRHRLIKKISTAVGSNISIGRGKENKYLSLVVCKDDTLPMEYLSYLQKEDKNPVHNLGETTMTVARGFKGQKKKEKKDKEKKDSEIIEEKVQELILKLKEKEDRTIIVEDVASIVVEYYRETGKKVLTFHMSSLIKTLALKYVPDYHYILYQKLLEDCLPRK